MSGGEGATVGWSGVELAVSNVCKVVCLKEEPVESVDYFLNVALSDFYSLDGKVLIRFNIQCR